MTPLAGPDVTAAYAACRAAQTATAAALTATLAALTAQVAAALAPRAPRVLIVDDDPDLAHAFAALLGDALPGVETVVHTDGRAALAAAADPAAGWALAVLDLHLGDGPTGLDVLRALPRRCRSIFVSGTVQRDLDKLAAAEGADAYFGKPPDPDALLATCARLLGPAAP